MLSRFFIERPIFAWVIALVIMGTGTLAIFQLPIEQYPTISAPTVVVSAFYPGASAQTLENTVTQVIEQNLTGIDNLRYIESISSSSGQASVTLTFEPNTDSDIAQVQTQNKVSQAEVLAAFYRATAGCFGPQVWKQLRADRSLLLEGRIAQSKRHLRFPGIQPGRTLEPGQRGG